MAYTKSQERAIHSIGRGNLQIIACAGSGKTEVLSAGIADLLKRERDKGLKPANIVAFTFTEKAAGELKERIHDRCKGALGSVQGMAEMYVGTIHGYCLNLLQSPPLYRYLKYRVLTDVQQRLLIDRFSSQSGLTSVPLLKGGTLRRWVDSRLYQQVLSIVTEEATPLNKLPTGVAEAIKNYRALIDKHRYLDYATIIAEAVAAIKSVTALRMTLQKSIRHLIVDEYQDVNPLQEALISELHVLGASLCVVGDDDQTIYQWRGSDVQNILTFPSRYQPVRVIKLNENFRSNSKIVDVARAVAERNTDRLVKKMESTNAQPFENGDLLAMQLADTDAEALWISGKIKGMQGWEYKDTPIRPSRGLSWSDFAILLRSVNRDAGPITNAFTAAGIPFVVGGMNELFSTPEIQAIRECFYFLSDFAGPGGGITKKHLVEALAGGRLGVNRNQVRRGVVYLEGQRLKITNKIISELYPQPLFQGLLREMGIREESIDTSHGAGVGEVVYFNLGKFSQLISDFEQIHFKSKSNELLGQFASFLCYQAPDYYPEGWQDTSQVRPDAVQIMTLHQAKGMQWPAVFIPCLRRNRFPSKAPGGRTVWHVIPQLAVPGWQRFVGTVEDERRLFYVGLTRAERFLFCSWAPVKDNQQQRNVSAFLNEFTGTDCILTKEPRSKARTLIQPRPRRNDSVLAISFSELKYYFECSYLFKLRFLYGFDAPISQALGYGKSLHDALAEIHSKAIQGEIFSAEEAPRLVKDHLFLPFASDEVRTFAEDSARKALSRYLSANQAYLGRLEHVEKPIELKMTDGTVVTGRIDLIRRTDTGEVAIVDFKSNEDAQTETITMRQLHVYALGYNQLTGRNADKVEIMNLDRGAARREQVDSELIQDTLQLMNKAGRDLRAGNLQRHRQWCDTCSSCDLSGICRDLVFKARTNS